MASLAILEADNAALQREIHRLRADLWAVTSERNRLADQLQWKSNMSTRTTKPTPKLPEPQADAPTQPVDTAVSKDAVIQALAQENARLSSDVAFLQDQIQRLSQKIMIPTAFGAVEVTSHGIRFLEKIALDSMAQAEKLKKEIEAVHENGGTI